MLLSLSPLFLATRIAGTRLYSSAGSATLDRLRETSQQWTLPPTPELLENKSYSEALMSVTQFINSQLREHMAKPTGDGVYTPHVLQKCYDDYVWGFNSPHLWKIEPSVVQDLYKRHTSENHCEVAIGTGYFLRSVGLEDLTLVDLNPNTLDVCTDVLRQASPDVRLNLIQHDILKPFERPAQYSSVAAVFLLHCLSGPRPEVPLRMMRHCAQLVADDGVFFGSTILGRTFDETSEPAALQTMQMYNQMGIFGNWDDDLVTIREALAASFLEVDVRAVGHCAVWEARRPKA